jgi:hypothetical protein
MRHQLACSNHNGITKSNRSAGLPLPHACLCAGAAILTGGATPKRVVISEWKSMDDAKKFYSSPAVKKASEDRKKFTSGQRTFIVEALAN